METVYLDTETTGVADDDEMVELTIIDDDGEPLINTLIKPKFHRTWAGAQRVHGISPLDVRHAPTQDEISDDIRKVVKGKRVVIYNAPFDSKFLPELEDAAEITCAMREFAKWNESRWKSLTNATKIIGYEWEGAYKCAFPIIVSDQETIGKNEEEYRNLEELVVNRDDVVGENILVPFTTRGYMTGVSLKDVLSWTGVGATVTNIPFDLGLYNLNAQGTLESSPTYHTIVINPTLGDADNMFGRYVETKGYYLDWGNLQNSIEAEFYDIEDPQVASSLYPQSNSGKQVRRVII